MLNGSSVTALWLDLPVQGEDLATTFQERPARQMHELYDRVEVYMHMECVSLTRAKDGFKRMFQWLLDAGLVLGTLLMMFSSG